MDQALNNSHVLGGAELLVTIALPKDSKSSTPDAKKETRIFAANIPAGTLDEELILYFSKWGTVTKVIQPAATTSQAKGYAFITYSSAQEKIAALSVKPHEIKGVELRVVEAKPKPTNAYFPLTFEPLQDPTVLREEFDENPTRLFVSRLPAEVSKEDLREYFSGFGQVADVFRPTTQPTGVDPKGFAFVTFKETKELWRALASGPHILRDHKVEVVEARPKTARGSGNTSTGTEPRVFVGRIPLDASEAEVKQYFGKFGPVNDVYRPKQNQKDGFYFAFVIFESANDVAKVLCEEQHFLPNRNSQLNVLRARPRIPGVTTAAAKSAIASAFFRLPQEQPSPYAEYPTGQFTVDGMNMVQNPYLMDPYGQHHATQLVGYDLGDFGDTRYASVNPAAFQNVSAYGPMAQTGKQHRYAPY